MYTSVYCVQVYTSLLSIQEYVEYMFNAHFISKCRLNRTIVNGKVDECNVENVEAITQ